MAMGQAIGGRVRPLMQPATGVVHTHTHRKHTHTQTFHMVKQSAKNAQLQT